MRSRPKSPPAHTTDYFACRVAQVFFLAKDPDAGNK
jgi:hypothetical protein